MNDKLRDELDERAERILPSYQVRFPQFPAVEQLVRESDAHMCEATECYRRALGQEALEQPSLRELLHTLVCLSAAQVAQGRAALVVLAAACEAGTEEREEEPEGAPLA